MPESLGTVTVEMVQQTREVTRSEQYFEEARRVLPGGVTAAARLQAGRLSYHSGEPARTAARPDKES